MKTNSISFSNYLYLFIILFTPFSIIKPQSYTQSGGDSTITNRTFTALNTDESGVTVTDSGILNLSNSTVTTTGNTSSNDNSSFYGLNAGVLAESASKINLTGCNIKTNGTGANGVFATGTGTSITLVNDTITCTNDGAHGVDATIAGTLVLTDVVINTAGAHGAAISTDRGGGTITVVRGNAVSAGQDSPGIYCTGDITVTDGIVTATGSEGAVIEGANSIVLNNTVLTGAKGTRDRGLLIYQSMSGDAEGNEGTFTMNGGSFTWPSTTGPAIYVTNTTAVINLNNVEINNSSETLMEASADQWGSSGSNGGTVILTADNQILTGDMIGDNISIITAILQDSTKFTGAVNKDNKAKSVSITLDASSVWILTADSYLNSFIDAGEISGTSITNITGNGFNIYYDASLSSNSYLNGLTYSLINGGELIPKSVTSINDQEEGAIPVNWELNQNYPNPFNPSTNITFTLPEESVVRLEVFNLLGKQVALLIDSKISAGIHNVRWNAFNLSSGVYLYRLTARALDGNKYINTKKMILMR